MAERKTAKKEEEPAKAKGSKYDIKVMDTAKANIPQRKAAKDGIMPRFPFSMMISGSSGSGKTNLLMNIMTREELYGRYFHTVLVFSPTAGSTDDTYKQLKIPKENFVREMKKEYLENLIANRKELIEKKGIEWVGKNARVCLIMDDVIAERSFLESPEALKMFALLRHYLCSIIVLMQSYNKLPKALRNNCNAMMIFPAKQSEVDVLKDEITPAGLTKREFENVIEYATAEPFHFLYINNHAKPGERIRHMLEEVIDPAKFKLEHIARRSKQEDVGTRTIESPKARGRSESARGQAVKPRPANDGEDRKPLHGQ